MRDEYGKESDQELMIKRANCVFVSKENRRKEIEVMFVCVFVGTYECMFSFSNIGNYNIAKFTVGQNSHEKKERNLFFNTEKETVMIQKIIFNFE